jgi:uncharacterized RDD family membrane protein YckC/ribosomal protein S27AE
VSGDQKPELKDQTCPKCKFVARPNERFCPKCGYRLNIAQEALQEQQFLNERIFGTQNEPNNEDFYFQRVLRESTAVPIVRNENTPIIPMSIPNYRYASTFSRIIAYLIDDILIFLLSAFLAQLIEPVQWTTTSSNSTVSTSEISSMTQTLSIYLSLLVLIKTVIAIGYFTIFETSRNGQTIGMFFLRIKIIDYRFNRPPTQRQVLIIALSKALELILILDILAFRFNRNVQRDPNIPIDLIKNEIRLSQHLAQVAIIYKENPNQ